MNLITFATLFLTVFAFAFGEQKALSLHSTIEHWMSADGSVTLVKSVMQPVQSEQDVRDQIGGMADTMLGGGLLLRPDTVECITLHGLPAVQFTGRSYAYFEVKECSLIVLFSTEHTYVLLALAPKGSSLPSVPVSSRFDGDPSKHAVVTLPLLEQKMRNGLQAVQRTIDRSVEVRSAAKK